jgi:hypothetical protein
VNRTSACHARAVGPRVETSDRSINVEQAGTRVAEQRGDLLTFKRNRVAFGIMFVIRGDLARRSDQVVETARECLQVLDCAVSFVQERDPDLVCIGGTRNVDLSRVSLRTASHYRGCLSGACADFHSAVLSFSQSLDRTRPMRAILPRLHNER